MTMPITDEIREAAKQAAREAVADWHGNRGEEEIAEDIKSGKHDDHPDVGDAILGARSALDAVYPLIRAEVLADAAPEDKDSGDQCLQKLQQLTTDLQEASIERDAAVEWAEAADAERDALLKVARAARDAHDRGWIPDDDGGPGAELIAALDALPEDLRARLSDHSD